MTPVAAEKPLVVVDADVLGRRRTGDETYIRSLLEAMEQEAADLRLAAVTRRPELVPWGVEVLPVPARGQLVRLGARLPLLLRKIRPGLVHTLYAVPPACPCPAVVTVQDLTFELAPNLMRPHEALIFRRVVRAAVKSARKVLTCSERTRRDLLRVYGLPESKVAVVPYGVDPVFAPGPAQREGFALCVGAVERRKDPLAALEAARGAGLDLVVAGPVRDLPLAVELQRRGANVAGYIPRDELARLYRRADCLVFSSRFEGFGFPVLEAMASGTPVVCADEPALRETAGDAAVFATDGGLVGAVKQALADRDRLATAGIERARRFTWRDAALRTLAVYREVLGT